MLKIGITGGIGSGKTTVCRIFEVLGIPVYYADDAAKRLMENDLALMGQVRHLFGKDIYQNGILQRKKLAAIVFNNPTLLNQLNSLVHPVVFKETEAWEQRQKDVPYLIKEAALLFESGSYKKQDKMITVVADRKLRIERLQQRDEATISAIEARMSKQWTDEQKTALSDFVIHNNKRSLLIPQVLEIHEKLVQLQGKI